MPEHAESLRDYFSKQRSKFISKYRDATFWVVRKDARKTALHYGRLLRRMEGR